MAQDSDDAIKAVFEAAGDAPQGEPAPDVLSDRVTLPGIGPRAWEHPADRAALEALRKVPGFDTVLRRSFGFVSERSLRLLYLANAVEVTPRQFKRVHALFTECCAILDAPKRPQLFVSQYPIVNAGAVGVDDPFIVINSGTLDLLTDDEVRFVLGHELGHVLSGHVLYKTMLHLMLRLMLTRIGLPGMLLTGVVMALKEWDRKSELSSDRAGLLCLQDPAAAWRVHMKMAGGSRVDEMDVDAFVEQAAAYEAGGDVRDGALKFINLLGQTHPFPVLRLAELKRWVDKGDYAAILAGDYPRRDQGSDFRADVTASVEAYRESVADSDDPFMKALRDLGTTVGDGAGALWDQVRDLFGRGKKAGDDGPDAPDEPGPRL
ncbi:MAG: M48 family metallopeptidase [Myxococcales bacterium]|nr:M48 family metallopeptidase [Myxococcales bacterium]